CGARTTPRPPPRRGGAQASHHRHVLPISRRAAGALRLRIARRLSAGDTARVLDGELLDVVRRAVGRDDVTYAEPPVRFSGGFFTENHAFRLADVPPPWNAELVVRLFPSESPA